MNSLTRKRSSKVISEFWCSNSQCMKFNWIFNIFSWFLNLVFLHFCQNIYCAGRPFLGTKKPSTHFINPYAVACKRKPREKIHSVWGWEWKLQILRKVQVIGKGQRRFSLPSPPYHPNHPRPTHSMQIKITMIKTCISPVSPPIGGFENKNRCSDFVQDTVQYLS
jgi:hypothetical protein